MKIPLNGRQNQTTSVYSTGLTKPRHANLFQEKVETTEVLKTAFCQIPQWRSTTAKEVKVDSAHGFFQHTLCFVERSQNSGEASTMISINLPKKSGSPVFSKFLTRRSVRASSSSSALLTPAKSCGGAGGGFGTFPLVSLVAVILIGFGDTGGGIFLPVTGSNRTGVVLEAIVTVNTRSLKRCNLLCSWQCVYWWIVCASCLVWKPNENEVECLEFGCKRVWGGHIQGHIRGYMQVWLQNGRGSVITSYQYSKYNWHKFSKKFSCKTLQNGQCYKKALILF